MASGKVHARVSIALSIPVGVAVGAVSGDVVMGLETGAGCLAGILLSPDLDQETFTLSDHLWLKYTGPLAFVWLFIWWPYAVIIPHRHWSSHGVVIGTILRLAYISLWLLPFEIFVPWLTYWPFVIGLMVSDIGHWLLDRR